MSPLGSPSQSFVPRAPFQTRWACWAPPLQGIRPSRQSHVAKADLTAGFLEAVASAALKARLQSYSLVDCKIDCNGFGLLTGRVDSVALAGRDWVSPLGLSAHVLDVFLEEAALDVPAILTQQRIMLLGVPQGLGRIVFSARQFDIFLQHPLISKAAATAVQGRGFTFDENSVCYNLSTGSILFSGVWEGTGLTYQLLMQSQNSTVIIKPLPEAEGVEAAAIVASELAYWFNRLTLDLQGPQLSYSSMELVSSDDLTSRSSILPPALRQQAWLQQPIAEAVLDLRLDVRVLGFPPPKLAF